MPLATDTALLCVIAQVCLTFGLAGLLFPEKLMPIFAILMYPWAASNRLIRLNSLAALGMALILLVSLRLR
ncbi:MAG: hypothetical protein ABSD53_16190 [Terriglobales bacterium]|jgi:hypothetical protein